VVSNPVVCAGCGALFHKGRWSPKGVPREDLRLAGAIDVRICPTCRREGSGLPHGFVHIDGDYTRAHRADIEALLHRDAAIAGRDNPLARVLDWGDDATGGILLTTTTEHLAIRLGHTLERRYQGHLLFGFSHENNLAHVWWHRDT
jgi:hypothetical protein